MSAMVAGCWISQRHSVAGPSTTTEGCALHLQSLTRPPLPNSKHAQGGFVSGRQYAEAKRNGDDGDGDK